MVMDERIAALNAATGQGRDAKRSDLYLVAAHASAAARRHRAVMRAVREAATAPSGSVAQVAASMVASGEAAEAAVSLYLAASAAQRYCRANDESGPLGLKRLSSLVDRTEQVRDAVMHWNQKLERDPNTFLAFSATDLIVQAPGKRGDTGLAQVGAIEWTEIEAAARRLYRWAVAMLDLPGWESGELDVALSERRGSPSEL